MWQVWELKNGLRNQKKIPNFNFIQLVVNYHPKPCASERTRSPCRFVSLFHFSAKRCVSDAHLRVRENPVIFGLIKLLFLLLLLNVEGLVV